VAVIEVQNPFLDRGIVRIRAAHSALEPISDRPQPMLTIASGALAMLLLWAPIVLELRPAAASDGLVGYVLVGVLIAAFAVFYGLLRLVIACSRSMPIEDDDLGGYRQPRREQGHWKLRILAVLGSVVHAVLYMQALP